MKTIYFIRHAHSDWSDPSLFDEERNVSAKGAEQIERMGEHLKRQGLHPDLILTSCAIRAQNTVLGLQSILNFRKKIHYLKELYMTSVQRVKETLVLLPENSETLFVVGHNAQLTALINEISDSTFSSIPTMGITQISFDIQKWSELSNVKGNVRAFIAPEDLKEVKAS